MHEAKKYSTIISLSFREVIKSMTQFEWVDVPVYSLLLERVWEVVSTKSSENILIGTHCIWLWASEPCPPKSIHVIRSSQPSYAAIAWRVIALPRETTSSHCHGQSKSIAYIYPIHWQWAPGDWLSVVAWHELIEIGQISFVFQKVTINADGQMYVFYTVPVVDSGRCSNSCRIKPRAHRDAAYHVTNTMRISKYKSDKK